MGAELAMGAMIDSRSQAIRWKIDKQTVLKQQDLAGLAAIDLHVLVADRVVHDRRDGGLDAELLGGLLHHLGAPVIDLQEALRADVLELQLRERGVRLGVLFGQTESAGKQVADRKPHTPVLKPR